MKKILLALAACGVGLAGIPGQSIAQQAQGSAAEPEVITVKSSQVGGKITLGGMVIPHKMVNLLAQMPGDVEFIAGQEGDHFRKGDVLVELDTSALEAKREQALTQLASARAGHRNAIVQYRQQLVSPQGQSDNMLGGMPSMFSMFTDPQRACSGQGSPGYERYSNIQGRGTQVETALHRIQEAQAAIAELDENIENAKSRAPFDGVIVGKMAEGGDIVQPGMPLVSYADTSLMQIQVEVPSRLLGVLQVGGRVLARLDRGEESIPVTVARIFPMAQEGGHTTTVKFDLPAGIDVQSGTYAEVMLQDDRRAERSLPVIPRSAIVWRGSLPAVFLVTEDRQLKMKVLRIGAETADGRVTVTSGLKPGDRILKEPLPSTRSGPMG